MVGHLLKRRGSIVTRPSDKGRRQRLASEQVTDFLTTNASNEVSKNVNKSADDRKTLQYWHQSPEDRGEQWTKQIRNRIKKTTPTSIKAPIVEIEGKDGLVVGLRINDKYSKSRFG